MYKISTQSHCACKSGESKGVVPVSLTASDNLEIWASCNDKKKTAYEFGCNHLLVAKGETVTLPVHAISEYNKAEGVHLHIRARSNTPHSPTSDVNWKTLPLSACQCSSPVASAAEAHGQFVLKGGTDVLR